MKIYRIIQTGTTAVPDFDYFTIKWSEGRWYGWNKGWTKWAIISPGYQQILNEILRNSGGTPPASSHPYVNAGKMEEVSHLEFLIDTGHDPEEEGFEP